MITLFVGLLAAATGGVAFRFAWRYWISIPDRNIGYWVYSGLVALIGLSAIVVMIAALGFLGIPAAVGTAMWLSAILALVYRSNELQKQYWGSFGQRAIDRRPELRDGQVRAPMSWLVRLFQLVAGDTTGARRK